MLAIEKTVSHRRLQRLLSSADNVLEMDDTYSRTTSATGRRSLRDLLKKHRIERLPWRR